MLLKEDYRCPESSSCGWATSQVRLCRIVIVVRISHSPVLLPRNHSYFYCYPLWMGSYLTNLVVVATKKKKKLIN